MLPAMFGSLFLATLLFAYVVSSARTAEFDEAAFSIVHEELPQPAIHGPRIVGSTPGRPFLFLIPTTGEMPLQLRRQESARRVSRSIPRRHHHRFAQKAGLDHRRNRMSNNARGSAKRELTIVGGPHKLALTPPMGWNSWNCWAGAVSDAKVRAAADAMVTSGLAAHGFQYINIDDCWEGKRDAQGEIQSNDKFPDMKALADYVHSKGLKLGIYSSPGRRPAPATKRVGSTKPRTPQRTRSGASII